MAFTHALRRVSMGAALSVLTLLPALSEPMTPPISTEKAPLAESPMPLFRPYLVQMPDLRWEDTAKGDLWTRASMNAISSHGQKLIKTVPQDISNWCPGYKSQDAHGRASFWAGLLSTLSYHESTWRETAVGGGGAWFGLTQIAPSTARWRQCRAQTGAELKNGVANLSCAVRIMNVTVPRDQVVSRGMKGVAADWGPFHSSKKREDMRRWLSAQPFCRPVLKSSPVPLLRPGSGYAIAFDDARSSNTPF
ncbi:transglycosylase SLT domain-containing protein [Celeribacter litoreus]|uniref:transglycosylase SLT domain-containing protein n=1 Tax=Celeribacter litoreus TaxID=2876714 RepID=UPI001CCDDAC1|nr:transglycosylase SLT domain-containing protein [Celeribacter litoreus]MCA0043113.1 transglycosylase SLT domain-containing protein [Celeribacter litoreus]